MSSLVYGIGGLVKVAPPALEGNAPPPASFKGILGQQFFDKSVSPAAEYIWNGSTWVSGGNAYATTTTAGIVELATAAEMSTGTSTTLVPPVKEVFDYVNSVAIAGAPISQNTVFGIVKLSSDADAVAGTANTAGVTAWVIQPSNLSAVFAEPPAIGGTTPAAGTFTTLDASGLITGTASATIDTGGTALSLGTDASADAINIGTGAAARTITLGNSTGATSIVLNAGTGALNIGTNAIAHTVTIGNVTGATAVNLNAGTGGIALASTGTGDIILNSDDTLLLDSDGVLELNSSAGIISIGNDADNFGIQIGAAGVRPLVVGNTTAGSTITISNGASYTCDGITTSTYAIGASTTTGTITIGGTAQTGLITLGSSSGTSTVKIASGAGASTVTIAEGTAGANTVSILNGNTAANAAVNILSGVGTAGAGTLAMGNNTRVTTIGLGDIAPAAARTVTICGGNAAQNDTLDIMPDAPSAGTQTVNVLSGTATGGTQALNLGTGATGVTTSIGAAAGTVNIDGTFLLNDSINANSSFNTGTSNGTISIGNSASGAQTWTVGTGNFSMVGGGNTVGIANDAAANLVTLGSATGAASLTLQSGSGNTAITSTGTILIDSAGVLELNSSAGVIGIGNDAVAQNINIGTGAAARVITLGNVTGATQLVLNAGTGGIQLASTGAGDITIDSDDTLLLDSDGVLELNSSSGAISIANDAVALTVNVATGAAAMTLNLGSTTTTSATNIDAGTGSIVLGSGVVVNTTSANTAGNPNQVDGSDYFISCDTTAAVTVTLPAAPVTGQTYVVADATGNAAAANITIDGNGKNIRGAGTLTVSTAYQVTVLWYNGTLWNYLQ